MDKMPLVSITIPAYNHERYVQNCIRSVIAQDYPRLEIVIIDDGSKDRTWEKIQEMRCDCEKRFERVVLIRQVNQGCAATVKKMVGMIQGAFSLGVASDDELMPNAVSDLIKPMLLDSQIAIVVGQNVLIDSNGVECYWDDKRNIVYDKTRAKYVTFNEYLEDISGINECSDDFGTYYSLLHVNNIANGVLKRVSFLREVDAYNIEARLEDWWLHLQLSKVGKYKAISANTFKYRWHQSNTVHNYRKMWDMMYSTLMTELKGILAAPEPVREKLVKLFDQNANAVKYVYYLPHIGSLQRRDYSDRYVYKIMFRKFCVFAITFRKKINL